ncbi:kinase-like domain-containing protein [Paraphysoderma sedebokerense]|nr:kinase-like domain-containing protein [Paraphysoderma sedebokerense]
MSWLQSLKGKSKTGKTNSQNSIGKDETGNSGPAITQHATATNPPTSQLGGLSISTNSKVAPVQSNSQLHPTKPQLDSLQNTSFQNTSSSMNSDNSVEPATPISFASLSTPATTDSNEKVPTGLLVIRVLECKELSVPNSISSKLNSSIIKTTFKPTPGQQQAYLYYNPYLVLSYDKNEIVVNSVTGTTTNPHYKHRAHFDAAADAELSISVLIRDVVDPNEVPQIKSPSSPANQNSKESRDILIGSTYLDLSSGIESDKIYDSWLPLSIPGAPATAAALGSVHIQYTLKKSTTKNTTIDDFDLLKVIGKGSFGKVMQVRKKDTGRIYALKILKKSQVVSRDEVEHTLSERNVLLKLRHPFIVSLKFAFQNSQKLYLVLPFINGGELFKHLSAAGRFSEERARFYIAELVTAIECLHGYNIIYRDLKPENILLDYLGHIALCDFGLCKLNMDSGTKTNTFCGTPEYIAPEVLLANGYTKSVDWWTLGILLYEMISGLPPFYDENVNEMYRKILYTPLTFPSYFSPSAISLLTGLINRDPVKRLGSGPNGAADIKSHPFFASVDWNKLLQKKIPPPFKPHVESAVDTSNFDEEFTSEAPVDSVVEDSVLLSQTVQQQFTGFSFNPGNELVSGTYQGTWGGDKMLKESISEEN